MLRVPTPEEEDRRRVSRELKALTAERVRHVNRVKGLLFAQGVSDTSRCAETGVHDWNNSGLVMVVHCRNT
jgi:transposase